MPNRSRKPPKKDFNQIARSIVDQVTGDSSPTTTTEPEKEKDPAAVALGRKGGLKGGVARAAKMTAKQRSESARKAAKARWAARKSK
jgi:hypothetical protein